MPATQIAAPASLRSMPRKLGRVAKVGTEVIPLYGERDLLRTEGGGRPQPCHLQRLRKCAIPAKAGIHSSATRAAAPWIPAFAGMANFKAVKALSARGPVALQPASPTLPRKRGGQGGRAGYTRSITVAMPWP